MQKMLKWSMYIGFLTIGFVSSLMGAMLPTIKPDIGISYSQAGWVLSGLFLGMFFTAICVGYLADKYGKKPVLMMGSILLFIGLLGNALSHSFASLFLFSNLTGIGFGTYEVGINALCADFTETKKGNAMNKLHFFYGAGAVLGPVLATIFTGIFGGWRLCFGFASVLPLIVNLMLFNVEINHKKRDNIKFSGSIYKSLFIWIAVLTTFLYVGIEASLYGWLPTYWDIVVSNSKIPSSLIASFFWISLTVARVFAGNLADHIGFSKYIILSCFATMCVSFVLFLIPSGMGTLICIILLGALLAGIFPTIMASTTWHYPKYSGLVAALVSSFASLGGSLIPTGIGYLADAYTVSALPVEIFAISVFLSISAFIGWKYAIMSPNDKIPPL